MFVFEIVGLSTINAFWADVYLVTILLAMFSYALAIMVSVSPALFTEIGKVKLRKFTIHSLFACGVVFLSLGLMVFTESKALTHAFIAFFYALYTLKTHSSSISSSKNKDSEALQN